MTLVSISQTNTVRNDSVTCIPNYQLRQAIKDIEAGEACKQENLLLNNNIFLLNKEISFKDSVINTDSIKEIKYLNIMNEYKDKEGVYEKEIGDYKNKLKESKFKSIGLGVGGFTITLGLTGLLIWKFLK